MNERLLDCESERVRSGSQLLSDIQTFFYVYFFFGFETARLHFSTLWQFPYMALHVLCNFSHFVSLFIKEDNVKLVSIFSSDELLVFTRK